MQPRPGVETPRALVFVFFGKAAKMGAAARSCSGPLGMIYRLKKRFAFSKQMPFTIFSRAF